MKSKCTGATEEQLRADQQELKTRELKKAKDVRRIRRIVHGNDNSKRASHVQDEMEKLQLV